MFQIGDIVMMGEDKQEGEIYGYVTEFEEETLYLCVSWFDGQKSIEFPKHVKKVENG
jgi:hypothetical protein